MYSVTRYLNLESTVGAGSVVPGHFELDQRISDYQSYPTQKHPPSFRMLRNKGMFLPRRHESLISELRCCETRGGGFLPRGGGFLLIVLIGLPSYNADGP